jgi:hypothetical protein
VQRRKQLGRWIAGEQGPRQRGDRLRGEAGDDELLGQSEPLQRTHHRPQSRVGACLVQPVGADEQHPPGAEASGQVVQQLRRGGVRPMQVIDQQGQRLFGRDPFDQPEH